MRATAALWTASLRLRLLAATLVAVALALGLAWVELAGLFRDHVMRQFEQGLAVQLDQGMARLAFDAAGQPQLDTTRLSDPRWIRPFGGLYWQLDGWAGAAPQAGLLRSRSLWDTALRVPADALADGAVHLHDMAGPDGAPLWLIERSVRAGPANGAGTAHGTDAGRWRLLLAANPRELSCGGPVCANAGGIAGGVAGAAERGGLGPGGRGPAAVGLPGLGVPAAPVVDGLLRLMGRVHAERGLDLAQAGIDAQLAFAGEQQDLQEMLGNLLDNACQWARHQVRLAVAREGAAGAAQLIFTLDDDGPGIAEDRREAVLARGQRLDESVPGSGLGLAIVDELATLYGGRLQLAPSPQGGLRVVLALPARACQPGSPRKNAITPSASLPKRSDSRSST